MLEAIVDLHEIQLSYVVLLLELPQHIVAGGLVGEQALLVEEAIIGEADVLLGSLADVDLHRCFYLLVGIVDDIVNAVPILAVLLLQQTQPPQVKSTEGGFEQAAAIRHVLLDDFQLVELGYGHYGIFGR